MDYEAKIREGGYKRIVSIAENILLRPNDTKTLLGEEKLNSLTKTLEKILEEYKSDPIYDYYYKLNTVEYGFCNFERWKSGLLF